MNWLLKVIVAALSFFVVCYSLYFYMAPNVTVVNKSNLALTEVNVALPSSNLDFGAIAEGQKNTIYYALSQQDGAYHYTIVLGGEIYSGRCGYVTSHELHKRFVITIEKSKIITCV